MTDSLTRSASLPPSDPAEVDAWLVEQEETIARLVRSRLRQIVTDAYEAFLDTLTASGDLGALDGIPTAWSAFVETELTDAVGGLYLKSGLTAWVSSGAEHVVTEAVAQRWGSVVNDNAVEYMRGATNRLVGVGNNVWWPIRSKARTALQEGWSTERLKESIEEVTSFSEQRADTVARTETVGAYNAGSYDSAAALGEHGPVEKWWMATDDARTRDSHRKADGQTVPFPEPFQVGHVRMMRPHDPGAPADEVVNCRCVVNTLYPGDKRPDGTTIPTKVVVVDKPKKVPPKRAATPPKKAPAVKKAPPKPKPPEVEAPAAVVHDLAVKRKGGKLTVDWATPKDLGLNDKTHTALLRNAEGNHSRADMSHAVARQHKGVLIIEEVDSSTWEGWHKRLTAGAPVENTARMKAATAQIDSIHALAPNQAKELKRVVLSNQRNPADVNWAKRYNRPGFRSEATGGNGTVTVYDGGDLREGTALHEFGHIVEPWNSSKEGYTAVSKTSEWSDAATADVEHQVQRFRAGDPIAGEFKAASHPVTLRKPAVTTYGAAAPAEDWAESVRLYLHDRKNGGLDGLRVGGRTARFKDIWPARAKVLDQIKW